MTNVFPLLGVNIDHVATLRQARGTPYPDPVQAGLLAEKAGADLLTLHLREDRRHIQEIDVRTLRHQLQTRMNLEASLDDKSVAFVFDICPQDVCLVPERREERTTEGGLDVKRHAAKLRELCPQLKKEGMRVALFIESNEESIQMAAEIGVPVVELHTGRFADAIDPAEMQRELNRLQKGARFAASLGLEAHAGHGLNYSNVAAVAKIPEIVELNIGHAIVAEAVFCGWHEAVARMKNLMKESRQ